MTNETYRRKNKYRFQTPIENRYEDYNWPKLITVKCNSCDNRITFNAVVPNRYVKNEKSGGYTFLVLPITGTIEGQGACSKCGKVFNKILWPQDAYFCFSVIGGDVWAWNEAYLHALKAKVAENRMLERHLCLKDWHYYYFLARLPKYVVMKRNRERILRKLADFLRNLNKLNLQ